MRRSGRSVMGARTLFGEERNRNDASMWNVRYWHKTDISLCTAFCTANVRFDPKRTLALRLCWTSVQSASRRFPRTSRGNPPSDPIEGAFKC